MFNITKEQLKKQGFISSTDKITTHGYQRFYPKHLNCLNKFNKVRIIEVGYGQGNSISFWKKIFPDSILYCFDKNKEVIGDGFNVYKCDQSDIEKLGFLCSKLNEICLVVDDGSHHPHHQIKTFNYLFKHVLSNGGIYIVEDIETSYWRFFDVYGYKTRFGIYHKKSAIECFKSVIDYINNKYISSSQYIKLKKKIIKSGFSIDAIDEISEISFAQNCIIIHKKESEDSAFNSRDYFYPWRISSMSALKQYFRIAYWKVFKRKWPNS